MRFCLFGDPVGSVQTCLVFRDCDLAEGSDDKEEFFEVPTVFMLVHVSFSSAFVCRCHMIPGSLACSAAAREGDVA